MTKLSGTVIACISAILLGVAPIARADTIDDPLHGHCLAGCSSNGTNTPIIGPTNGLYFQASPGPQTGILLVDILVPDSIPPIKLTELHPGVVIVNFGGSGYGGVLVYSVPWTSGTLGDYLVASGNSLITPNIKPANPIDAFLPSTQALDPAATGFYVFETFLGGAVYAGAGRRGTGLGADLQLEWWCDAARHLCPSHVAPVGRQNDRDGQ
jgi:hypothetical protein